MNGLATKLDSVGQVTSNRWLDTFSGVLSRAFGTGPPAGAAGPEAPRPPLSVKVVDAFTIIFALWTLTCHAVVIVGGTFRTLQWSWLLVFCIAVAIWWRYRGQGWRSWESPASPPSTESPWLQRWRQVGLLAASAAFVCTYTANWTVRWWALMAVLVPAAICLLILERAADPPSFEIPRRDRRAETWLWALASICAALSLIAHRPNSDDSFYVNLAVSALDLRNWPLLSSETLHTMGKLPLHLPVYRWHTYEFWNALLSSLTGLAPIKAFHWLSTAFGAALVPLAMARLLRILVPRIWPYTLTLYILVLVGMGGTARWYGNFSFLRMWQGKAYLLFIFLPLIWAFAFRFARRPELRSWLLLFAAMVSAIGSSSTALWVAPVTAMIGMAAASRLSLRSLAIMIAGSTTAIYPAIVGLSMKSRVTGLIFGPREPGKIKALPGAVQEVFGEGHMPLLLLGISLSAWVLAPSKASRRLALVSCLAVWAILLNPYWASWTIKNLSGPSFWRVFWVLPFPLLLALVLSAPLASTPEGPGKKALLATAFWAASILALVPAYHGLSPQNRVEIEFPPGLKVPPAYEWAVDLAASVKPRSRVLAPDSIGLWIPTLRHHPYPLLVRKYLNMERGSVSAGGLSLRRDLTRYTSVGLRNGRNGPQLRLGELRRRFKAGLEQFDVKGVCLRLENFRDLEHVRQILSEAGFVRGKSDDSFEIWARP